jgi:hypothetical protein
VNLDPHTSAYPIAQNQSAYPIAQKKVKNHVEQSKKQKKKATLLHSLVFFWRQKDSLHNMAFSFSSLSFFHFIDIFYFLESK